MSLKRLAALLLFFASPMLAQSGHSAKLTWVDTINPAGSTTYSVYKAPGACSSTSTFTKVTSGLTVLTYTDANIPVGSTCYQVTATVGGVEGPDSNQVAASVPGAVVLSITVTTP